MSNTRHYWTHGDDALLRDLYPDVPTADIAALMDLRLGQVYQRAARLRIGKSPEFLALDASGRVRRGKQHPRMIASQFQPGLIPWNKGVHYVAGGRSAETRFKKGCMSGAAQHNYVPIGSLRTNAEGYLERKMTDDQALAPARRWVGVHRLVWIQTHGALPPGHIVRFRPGMATAVLEQITVERLECISRAEHARRNHPSSKHPELGRLVQLKGAITRQVRRIAREQQSTNDGATAP